MQNKAYLSNMEKEFKEKILWIEKFTPEEKAEQKDSLLWMLLNEDKSHIETRFIFLFNGDYGCYEKSAAENGDSKKAFEILCVVEFSVGPKVAAAVYTEHKSLIEGIIAAVNPPAMKQSVLQECYLAEANLIKLPERRLDREVYLEVKNALELIGGKWNTAKQGFIFKSSPKELLDKLATGENINLKKEFQFFATPPKIAKRLVELAELKFDDKVLEPSAGQGAIIKAIHDQFPEMKVDCYEAMEVNRMFLKDIRGVNLIGDDFLECKSDPFYDKIIANPPFSKGKDLVHFMKMWEMLKPGGTLLCMSSPSWRTGTQKKQVAFQNFINENSAEIHEVAAGEFTESGTEIATLIIKVEKK